MLSGPYTNTGYPPSPPPTYTSRDKVSYIFLFYLNKVCMILRPHNILQNFKNSNNFSDHDNRNSFQDHGVYFGDVSELLQL